LNEDVKEILIEEPYVKEHYQVKYWIRIHLNRDLINLLQLLALQFSNVLWVGSFKVQELKMY
jgi:hypothetical protein